jgi:hypothetical protein
MAPRSLTLALALALASGAGADAVLHFTTDEPSRISVDGEDIGPAPLTIRDMRPGRYEIAVENTHTGQVKSYLVRSPRSARVERNYTVNFAPPLQADASAPRPPPAPALEPALGGVAVPLAETPPPANAVLPPAAPGAIPAADPAVAAKMAKDRARARTRAAVIGVAVADALLVKKKRTKNRILGAALGVGVLNEVFNR